MRSQYTILYEGGNETKYSCRVHGSKFHFALHLPNISYSSSITSGTLYSGAARPPRPPSPKGHKIRPSVGGIPSGMCHDPITQ